MFSAHVILMTSLGSSGASLVAQLVKNLPAVWETWVQSLVWEDPWRRERLPTPVFWPGEFHGLYSPWDHKESDVTEQLSFSFLLWLFRIALIWTVYVSIATAWVVFVGLRIVFLNLFYDLGIGHVDSL